MIATNAGIASPAWLPQYKNMGETMAGITTVKGVEKREDSVYKKLAKQLYREFSEKGEYKSLLESDYYDYLKVFRIHERTGFAASLGGDMRKVKDIVGRTIDEMDRLEAPSALQKKAAAKITAETKAAKVEAPAVTAAAVPKVEATAQAEPTAAEKAWLVPAKATEETAAYQDAKAVFERKSNEITTEVEEDKTTKAVTVYNRPGNIGALGSVTTDWAALKKATGVDFMKELNGVSDLSVAGNKEIAEHIIDRIIGSYVLYNAFRLASMRDSIESGTKMDEKVADLSKYISSGYAEYLGSALKYMDLQNQGEFNKQVMTFLESHIKKGKLDELGEFGERAEYAIAAIGTAFAMQFFYEHNSAIREPKAKRHDDITKRLSEIDIQLKKKMAVAERDRLVKESDDLNSELKIVDEALDQLDRASIKPKKISQFYEDNIKLLGGMDMNNLKDYIGKRVAGLSMLKKAAFLEMMHQEGRQQIIMQTALEETMGAVGQSQMLEAGKYIDMGKNYYRGVMGVLKEFATTNLSSIEREMYGQIESTYREQIKDITDKMKPEDATKFIIDLIDPLMAQKNGQAYGDYLKVTIRNKWKELCLDDFKSDFKTRFYFELKTIDNIKTSEDIKTNDDNIVSLIFDHRIIAEEMNYVIRNGGSLDNVIKKLVNAKEYFRGRGPLEERKKEITESLAQIGSVMKDPKAMKTMSQDAKDRLTKVGDNLNKELNAVNERLMQLKNDKEYKVIFDAMEKAAGKLGIDPAFKDEFYSLMLSRLAIMDAVNDGTKDLPFLTLDGMAFKDEKGATFKGKNAFSEMMGRLNAERIQTSARGYRVIKGLSTDEEPIVRDLELADRVHAYLKLYHNKYFKLEDKSRTMITSDVLNYFKVRVDIEREYIQMLSKDESYIAENPQLKKDSDKTLEYTASRIDHFIKGLGNEKGASLNLAELMKDPNISDGDKFILDNMLNGRIVIAGPHGWNVMNDMASVTTQGFTPITYFFMNQPTLMTAVLGSTENELLSITEKDRKQKEEQEEKKFATEGWNYITGSRANENFNDRAFPQAYKYYNDEYKKDSKYENGKLDDKIKYVFGESVLSNLNRSVSLAADYYIWNLRQAKQEITAKDISKLKLRLKLLYVSEIIVESNFGDLCHDPRTFTNPADKNTENNMMERWVKAFRESIAGIQVTDIAIMQGTKDKPGFIDNIAKSKWAKMLKSGQYTIEFDDGEHIKRSFDVTVEAPKVGEGTKSAVTNIKIEPVEPLQNLIDSGFMLYGGDRITMRDKKSGEIALVSKSNTAILLVISAKVGGTGYEVPLNPIGMLDLNFVPNGFYETGLIPTSYHGGYYRAFVTQSSEFVNIDKTMPFVEKMATYTPIYINPTIEPFAETQTIPITTTNINMIMEKTTSGGAAPGDIALFQGHAQVVIRTDYLGHVQYSVNRVENGVIYEELTQSNMTTLLNNIFPEDPNKPGAAEQARGKFLGAFYGTNTDPNAKIGLSRDGSGNIVVATYDKQGNMAQGGVILVDNGTISKILYGEFLDRVTVYFVQTASARLGKKITLNGKLEEGTEPFATTEQRRQYILNLMLNMNIPYTQWEKMLTRTSSVGVEAYILAECRDILSSNRRIITGGIGATANWETEHTTTAFTTQALGGYQQGAPAGQQKIITSNVVLKETYRPGTMFDVYGTLGLNLNNPLENVPGGGTIDIGLEKTAGIGLDWRMNWDWTMGAGADVTWSNANMYTTNVSLGYKKVAGLNVLGGAKLDPLYGPNMLFGKRAVFFAQARLTYNIGLLNKPKKEGGKK